MKPFRNILISAVCLLAMGACSSREEIVYSADPVYNIETLWRIIDTRYCYVEDKGCDWNAIRTEYIEKASQIEAGKDVELFDLCAAMLDSLRDGHVNLYSGFDRSYCSEWYDSYPANFNSRLQRLYMTNSRIAGGIEYCAVDNDSIGYLYYSSFNSDFSEGNLAWIFSILQHCKGLIVDVRNNGGGSLNYAYLLAAPFFTENQTIGYWQHKIGSGHHDFSELQPLTEEASLTRLKWDKPVVVLCNRRTYSAANMFVNIMRYAPNATIIGGRSGGGGGMPMSYDLPIGWMVRFSSVRMYDRDKKDIENGIVPDIEVTQTSTDKDDLIEAAIALINSK